MNARVDEAFEIVAEPEPAGYREQHLIGICVDVGQHQTELDLGQPEIGEQRQITGRDDVVEVLVRRLRDLRAIRVPRAPRPIRRPPSRPTAAAGRRRRSAAQR